jgi:aspartate/methionine/tyrosine aminotransferase
VTAIPVDASSDYQLNAALIAEHWDDDTVGVILASPSNPTGTLIDAKVLQQITDAVQQRNGVVLMDEIYHGLVYGERAVSILEFTDQAFVINSFSKFYGMTGWRLGWLVVPEQFRTIADNFAQNIFLAAPTPAQHAALAAFNKDTQAILLQRRDEFRQRRDYLLQEVKAIGFDVKVVPQGAFYIYADSSRFTDNSMRFAEALLEEAGVAITPGNDFGEHRAASHVRFAYTTTLDRLQEGVRRICDFVK